MLEHSGICLYNNVIGKAPIERKVKMARTVKEWISKDGSFAIKVNDDMSYQILKDGEVINTNHAMDKWYDTAGQVATHIQNDIDFGYYPKLAGIKGELVKA